MRATGRGLIAAMSASAQAVADKFADIASKHNEHVADVEQLHALALDEALPAVLHGVGLQGDARAARHVKQYLDERATLFRFYRRSRYSIATALDMLTATLSWRLRTDLDSLSLSSLHPLYASPPDRPPLFWASTRCFDRFGRPAGIISLQSLERVTRDDGSSSLDECREYIVGCMEGMRRYLDALYTSSLPAGSGAQPIDVNAAAGDAKANVAETGRSAPRRPLQMVIIFSLQSSGMANLELELLPFLLDLLKNHFPGMVGAVYVMHFGWMHSGMWALAKRILPQQALARIFFPSQKDMAEHFPLKSLPSQLGGSLDMELNDRTNDVMRKFAQPRWAKNKQLLREAAGISVSSSQGIEEAADDVADDEQSDEAVSAPPSPRGQSGTTTPHAAASASWRQHRSLSRAGSFDSLVDEFHSVDTSPWASRSVTPRASRPTTPRAELIGFTMSRAHETRTQDPSASSSPVETPLQLTPSAAKKLRHLQTIRGVPSQGRSRTNSEATAGEPSSGGDRQSPSVSRPPSPGVVRRRTLVGPTARPGRFVHFDHGNNGSALGIDFPESQPIQRVGSLRDFRLGASDLAQSVDGIGAELSEDVNSPKSHGHRTRKASGNGDESSDASEKSGKAGEIAADKDATAAPASERGASSFFARFRRAARAGETPELSRQADEDERAIKDKDSMGRDDEYEDELETLSPEPKEPDSPHLQVPHIEEPPLAEQERFFSRRSRLYGSLPGHVSPYNASNPFYGYPVLPDNSIGYEQGPHVLSGYAAASAPSGPVALASNDPQRRYRFQRRKRDLVRTLIYLFVLRLLAMHRHVRRALLASYRGTVRAITVGGLAADDTDDAGALQQQHERYERLRNAGARFSMANSGRGKPSSSSGPGGSNNASEKEATAGSAGNKLSMLQPQPQPQPLVALGMRKRYVVLSLVVLFLLLRRYEWRRRRV